MPQSTNRVTLSKTAKDQWGLPAPNVHFDDHPNDIAMRNYAYEKQKLIICWSNSTKETSLRIHQLIILYKIV